MVLTVQTWRKQANKFYKSLLWGTSVCALSETQSLGILTAKTAKVGEYLILIIGVLDGDKNVVKSSAP